mmetsp:Transcript_7314/g.25776  ORF Transcript_7314/g.25776 Transcript_7314/m.25776 type:complete len:221 (+) Transcript_7314:120-782(+)
MLGFRYSYSASSPRALATGTTTLSSAHPCTPRTKKSSLLLKSSTAAVPPGLSTRQSSRSALGRSDTLRRPYPMVAQSKEASPNGMASASPSTHCTPGRRRRTAGGSARSRCAATPRSSDAKSSARTEPRGPAASARRRAMSPLPVHTSRHADPGFAPAHCTAARFHTRCCPRESRSLSSSYAGATLLKSSWRAAAASAPSRDAARSTRPPGPGPPDAAGA